MKDEALKLADVGTPDSELAIHKTMIRRLVEELDKQKPLSDEEIKQIFVEESGFDVDTCPIAIMDFARAIEERHGIYVQKT